MRTRMLLSVATLMLTLVLAGCHGEHSEPTPMTELPELERSLAEVERRDGRLYVPRAAVAERRGLNQVFVLHEGEARARQVQLGRASGDRVEILAGVWVDEQVLVGDLAEVHDGSPITPR
ncbi:MAG: hypothetical protein ACQERR_02320 [Pseudomonadota bacterium]